MCADCQGDPAQCKDRPSEASPITDDSIGLVVTECPLEYITDDIWLVLAYVELYEKGLAPVAGGALDQAQSFIEAATFAMAERAFWKKKLKLI